MEKFTEQDVRRYQRENKSFVAYGSEGTVFKYEDYAVKIFKSVRGKEFMKDKEEKVKAIMKKELEGFCKPEFLVYNENGEFSGYAMNYYENKGDVSDLCYKFGDEYTLDQKIEYLLKVEELIKKAHEKGFVLNDVAIWNFLITDSNKVMGIDTDNFQFDEHKTDTNVYLYLPYYQGLCNTEGHTVDSDKFSFALFALRALMQRPFNDEYVTYYDKNSNYLLNSFLRFDVNEEVKDEFRNLMSSNPEKEWIGKTLEKVSSSTRKYL